MFQKTTKKQRLNLSTRATEEKKQDTDLAATRIQRFYRKNRPLIPSQEAKKTTDYGVLLLGNDPDISGLEKYSKTNEPVALIATGGLRSIYLACQLGNDTFLPKIILIDNSSCVITFWQNLREYFNEASSESDFLDGIKDFIIENHKVFQISKIISSPGMTQAAYKLSYQEKVLQLKQTAYDYLKVIFSAYGFEYVQDIIKNMLIVNQSVEDENTFIKLKNIFDISKIKNVFVYFSNIISYTKINHIRDAIMKNLVLLNPSLSIHTDLFLDKNKTGLMAKHVYFFEKQSPAEMKEKLIDIKTSFQCLLGDAAWEHDEKENIAYIAHSDIEKLKKYAHILHNLGFKSALNEQKSQYYVLYVFDARKIRDCDHSIDPNERQAKSSI